MAFESNILHYDVRGNVLRVPACQMILYLRREYGKHKNGAKTYSLVGAGLDVSNHGERSSNH